MSAFFSGLKNRKDVLGVLACLFGFFVAVTIFRPLLPVDETRYLSVAWEMYQHKSYFLLTNNGEPYHHKPPLLFWLINLSWQIFGVSRAAAMVPIFLISASWILVMRQLFITLWPEQKSRDAALLWFLLGSVPFLIYATMIMFDMTLALCVGLVLIGLWRYAQSGRWRYAVMAGLALGLGILAKGPPEALFLIGPLLGYAWWTKGQGARFISGKRFASGVALMFLSALLSVACWFVPLVLQADLDFLMSLIWKQSAGRVSGHMSGSHARPFYFYLMLAPVLFLPWVAFTSVRKGVRQTVRSGLQDARVRYLVSVIAAAFILFSFISGKQPHYLVPLVGPLLLLMFASAPNLQKAHIRNVALGLVFALCLAHAVGSKTFFSVFNVKPLIEKLQDTPHSVIAWSRNYQNEIGFQAKLSAPIESLHKDEIVTWLNNNPEGIVIYRFSPHKPEELEGLDCFYQQPYRHKQLGLCVLEGDPRGRDE